MSEYIVDRLRGEIRNLNLEIEYLQKTLKSYRETDKDKAIVEAAIFIFGVAIGTFTGVYFQ